MINRQKLQSLKISLFILSVGLVLSVVFTFLFFDDVYLMLKGPISKIHTMEKDDSGIVLSFETRLPTMTKVYYGISPETLNSIEATSSYETSHSLIISRVLPNRAHYIFVELLTKNGRRFVQDYYLSN